MPQQSRQQSISQQCPQQPQPLRTRWWFTTQQRATMLTMMFLLGWLYRYIKPTSILMRGVNASFAEKGIEIVLRCCWNEIVHQGYGWWHVSNLTLRLGGWYWDHVSPIQPRQFQRSHARIWGRDRLKTVGIFSQQHSVTISQILFERFSLIQRCH
jgi:hypothetical protein